MYAIVNTSGRHLSLQDLRVMLSPRERIDLDSVCDRREIEASTHLKHALKKGYVKVVVKDKEGHDFSVPQTQSGITKDDLNKIKSEIASIIQDAIKSMPSSTVVVQGGVVDKNADHVDHGIEMSDEVLDHIHKKAVDRLMNNTEKTVDVKPVHGSNLNIKKNLDELEDLL
jgi:type IV secretory pathway VirB4 component